MRPRSRVWCWAAVAIAWGLPLPVHAVATSTAPILVALPEPEALSPAPARLAAAFEANSPGHWALEWDARTGTLAAGVRGTFAPGPLATAAQIRAAALEFRVAQAPWLGAHRTTLREVRAESLGRAWHVTWQQLDAGRPVLGAFLDLTLHESGAVVSFRSSLVPGAAAPPGRLEASAGAAVAAARLGKQVRIAAAEAVVVALPAAAGLTTRPALRLDLRSGHAERWNALVDANDGQLLALESGLRFERVEGTCSADAPALYALDEPQSAPLPWLEVVLDDGATRTIGHADGAGAFTLQRAPAHSVQLTARLFGSYLRVSNVAGGPQAGFATPVSVPGSATVHFATAQARLDERAIYVHANRIHDYARARFNFRLLDFQMPAVAAARDPGNGNADYANAYWDGTGIHFGTGGAAFYNLGLFADVIYHEYTHAITDYMYRPFGGLAGLQGGAIHEGLSDYFACTLTNEPRVAENAIRDGLRDALRNLENGLQWPQDAVFEVHGDGEILGGALWDIRRLVGAEVADPIIHFARALGPRNFDTYATAILLQDDLLFGDGQAYNGSPHRDAIVSALGSHGLGPAASLGRQMVHEPLRDTEAVGRARPVHVGFENHLSSSGDTLRLAWSSGGPFTWQLMQRQPDGDFAAEIPAAAMREGATIRYYLRLAAQRRNNPRTLPQGAPDSTYRFRVGPDHEPPQITHAAIDRAAAFAWPAQLVAEIDDNLAVANAWVEYRRNGEPGPMLGMVRSENSPHRFATEFPNAGALGDIIEYWIVAEDASRAGNRRRLPEAGVLRFELVDALADGFETSAGAWQHSPLGPSIADTWQLDARFNHTPGGARAWICGAVSGEYPSGMAAALETERYPLAGGAHFEIWSRIDAEPNGPNEAFDGGVVQIQIDDEPEWRTLVPEGGYTHVLVTSAGGGALPAGTACLSGRDSGWLPLRFDLAAHAGHAVRLRFLFASDAVMSPFALRGWALDDFDLDAGVRSPTDAMPELARAFRLLQAPPSPNPFNPRLEFSLAVPDDLGPVQLALFDARGRQVRELLDGPLVAGTRRIGWDGTADGGLALPSGVYYYRLVSRLGAERGAVVLVR